ncbi:MAG: mannitol dehydrogenase family protein [Actinomycetota bacterium]|nr:mannitol dehydrogenase family protein [Actinomycetota bacterium]
MTTRCSPAPARLSRSGGDARAAAPVGLVHLGLGNFFRAHQAWYTHHAADAAAWGHAAFAWRRGELASTLQAQDCLYTLIERGPSTDTVEIVASVSEAHGGADHAAWLAALASARVAVVTLTVTEAGYCRGPDGRLDAGREDVAADVARLRDDLAAPVTTAPARLVAGLAARRAAGNGPLALVPCDNVPGNAELVRHVVGDLACQVEPALAEWIGESTAVVATVVDRITPRAGSAEIETAAKSTGRCDEVPVVTEAYSEWVLSGTFPAGRPRWEDAGAVFTEDVSGYERRKLWLLNGAHSLLAYAGSMLGHASVADAFADDRCREWVEQWWATAAAHLDQPPGEIAAYEAALGERFANARMHDQLARIAEDGSEKLVVRVLPVLRAERAAGRLPAAGTRILGAWLCHLRGFGAPVHDVRAAQLVPLATGSVRHAARKVLCAIDSELASDAEVVAAVAEQCQALVGAEK